MEDLSINEYNISLYYQRRKLLYKLAALERGEK